MKEYQLNTTMRAYQWDELSDEQREVVSIAKEQTANSYCPYSGFHVGAAAKLANGMIIRGANQENAAYPSGLCAERTATFYASAQYPEIPFNKLAITAINPTEKLTKPVSPCGSCRQALLEYEQKFNQHIEVLLAGEEGEVYVLKSISDLLPFSFSSDYLP